MRLVNFLRKFCIMKSVRDKAVEGSDNKPNEKIQYIGISENVFLPNKEIKIEEIGKEIGENINQHISKLSKKNIPDLNSAYEDVKNEKSMFEKKVNQGYLDKDYEKINIVNSGFDILLSAIKEEIEKRSNEE